MHIGHNTRSASEGIVLCVMWQSKTVCSYQCMMKNGTLQPVLFSGFPPLQDFLATCCGIPILQVGCDACASMQDIQELTPDIARRHGLSLKEWPMPSEASLASTEEQLSNVSLNGDQNNHGKELSAAPKPSQKAMTTSHGKEDPTHNDNYQKSAQPGHDRSTSSSISGQQNTFTTSQRDAEALNTTSAEPLQHGDEKSVSKREHLRQGVETLALSQATSVPGHRWLPCPRVATPDAAVSDFITVTPVSFASQTRTVRRSGLQSLTDLPLHQLTRITAK